MLLPSGAAGGVIGGLLCSKRTEILGRRLALLSALLITAAGDVLLAVHPTIGFVAVSLFDNVLGPVVKCGNCLVSPSVHSQRALGRVNSIYRFLAGIHCCFGALASGAIVVWVKPELGRGLALRIPFFVKAVVLLQYFFM